MLKEIIVGGPILYAGVMQTTHGSVDAFLKGGDNI